MVGRTAFGANEGVASEAEHEARARARARRPARCWSQGDWAAAAPVQPHLGDFMIGTAAGKQNARRALAAGITTIGNLGQFLAFDPPDGTPGEDLAALTVQALRLGIRCVDRIEESASCRIRTPESALVVGFGR